MFLDAKAGWWVPHWQPCGVKGLDPASCLHFCLHLLSLDLSRSTQSSVVVVKRPQGMWPHQDTSENCRGMEEKWGRLTTNRTWVSLADSHSSWNELRTFLIGGKQSYASRTPSWFNARFSSYDFRQTSYLFPALFSEEMRIPTFACDLSPSKAEVSQEHLSWGQWICKDIKTGEINSVQLQVYLDLRCPWLFFTPHCMMCI